MKHGLTAAPCQDETDHWVHRGYRLTPVSGYERDGDERYAAISETP